MSTNYPDALISAIAVTSTQTSNSQANSGHRGAHIIIDVTAVATGASLTPSIIGLGKGIEYTMLMGSAIASTGITVLKVYPGIIAAANASASDVLPPEWRLNVDVTGGAVSFTAIANLLI